MIKNIEINNFRCFENTKIADFEKINLIGGKNNAGKTALLEALLLNDSPQAQSAVTLQNIRRQSKEILKSIPNRAWDNLFFNQNKDQKIELISENNAGSKRYIEISVEQSINKDFFDEDDEESSKILDFFSKNPTIVSTLNFGVKDDEHKDLLRSSVLASSRGLIAHGVPDPTDTAIIPSFLRTSNEDLKNAYDRARLDYKDGEILKAFQILDPSIQGVDGLFDTLYLTRENQGRLPLSLFGDAINRIADIILKLINNDHKILLIDEIENGIHYTNQRDFWKTLFRLAVELDTQIFATTHSLEMIEAFADVGLGNYEGCANYRGLGAYFEMSKRPKTNKIVAIKRDLETLNYALERGKGVRGE
jgi:AAA15 family ATPase/GTPase